MQKAWLAISLIAAVPGVGPEIVREAIRDNPLYYGTVATLLALFAGFVVQIHERIEGRVTWAQVCSALLFSLLAGVMAIIIAAIRDYDAFIAYACAVIGGMWGKRSVGTVYFWGVEVAREVASRATRVPLRAEDEREPPN